MNNDASHMNRDNDLLARIEEGMAVFDRDNNRIGTVDYVHFAEGHDSASISDQGDDRSGLSEMIADVFGAHDDMPEEVQERLYRHGFGRVDGSIFSRTHYFIPEHIRAVTDEGVRLNIVRGEMITA